MGEKTNKNNLHTNKTPSGLGRDLVKRQKQQFMVIASVRSTSPFKQTKTKTKACVFHRQTSSAVVHHDSNHSFITNCLR